METAVVLKIGVNNVTYAVRNFIFYVKNRVAFNRAICDGEVLQVSDLKDGIAMHACDYRAACSG